MPDISLRRIGGAISQVWAGGDGPTRSKALSALQVAGFDGDANEGNKQQLVLNAITSAPDDTTAKLMIEELLNLLRVEGNFEADRSRDEVERLKEQIRKEGHAIDDDGYVTWTDPLVALAGLGPAALPAPAVARRMVEALPIPEPPGPALAGRALEVTSPDLGLLCSVLRRVGQGATRTLVKRRRRRAGITIHDEYDMQDIIEALLRAMYSDVRCEEPTPSSAGSSSRMDLLLREGRTAVEVKVTADGRREKHVKPELLADINDYRAHPTVDTLVIVIYDLAETFENPAGFEHDLSANYNGLDVHVLVATVSGPRDGTPPADA